MRLFILAVGHKMPGWIETAFAEYAKRMPPELRIELKEIKPEQRSNSRTAETVMAAEAQRIDAALPRGCRLVCLDERGQDLTTMRLAQSLTGWQQDGRDVAFVIGGPTGSTRRSRRARTPLSGSPASPCPTAWCAYSSPSSCIARGASTPITPITGSERVSASPATPIFPMSAARQK